MRSRIDGNKKGYTKINRNGRQSGPPSKFFCRVPVRLVSAFFFRAECVLRAARCRPRAPPKRFASAWLFSFENSRRAARSTHSARKNTQEPQSVRAKKRFAAVRSFCTKFQYIVLFYLTSFTYSIKIDLILTELRCAGRFGDVGAKLCFLMSGRKRGPTSGRSKPVVSCNSGAGSVAKQRLIIYGGASK